MLGDWAQLDVRRSVDFCPHPAFGHPLPHSGRGIHVRDYLILRQI